MPTGYTADVKDGRVTHVADFIAKCARNFGFLISMRDEDWSASLPDEIKPSSFHADKLRSSQEELTALNALSQEERAERCAAANAKASEDYRRAVDRNEAERARYDSMLSKVLAWQPASDVLLNVRRFAIEQLRESMKFDLYEPDRPKPKTVDQWFLDAREAALRDIAYHSEEHAKETKRAAERNECLQALHGELKKLREAP